MSGGPGAEPLGQEEAFARIRLLRSPNVGPVTYAQLLARFGSALAALEALPGLAGRAGRAYTIAPERRVHDEVKPSTMPARDFSSTIRRTIRRSLPRPEVLRRS